MNPGGVEVVSILLSTQTEGGSNDTDTIGIASNNGYDFAGVDADAGRGNVRAGLAYYRGIPITSWPVSDRRRLAVVNLVAGSPSHQQYEILYNREVPDSAAVRAAIDAVQPPPSGVTFEAWKTANAVPPARDGPNDDPDFDGSPNLIEFHAGTDPLDAASRPNPTLLRTPGGFAYTYQRATDRIGITHILQTGPLDALSAFAPSGEMLMNVAVDVELVTVILPPGSGPFLRESVTLDP